MASHPVTHRTRHPTAIEWPTAVLASVIYGGWTVLILCHGRLPLPVTIAAGAWLIAWHGSLQHETIHGHPTRNPTINALIGAIPLSLWIPYAIYRDSHVAHHRSPHITDPLHDPESRYVGHGGGSRWSARLQATLIGRLILGPPLAVIALLRDEGRRVGREPARVVRDWVPHLIAVAGIVAVLEATGFGVVRYILLIVWPGTSLTLLRSFAEHRADLPGPARAATVERGGLLGLLYLNNHLHAAHHDRPDLAWYRLPDHQRRHRERLLAPAGRAHRSYGEIIRRFAFRPHDRLVHPEHDR